MICLTCQTPNDPTSRFCTSCGADIATPTPVAKSADATESDRSASKAFAPFDKDAKPASALADDEVTLVSSADSRQRATTVSSSGRTGAATSHIGRTIEGRYRIDAKIGVGGMGAVYRAARLLISDEVAIKILHPEHVSEPGASERFKREAQAAARLKHPNAVFIIDFGITSDGIVYLVMELLHGQSLRQIIKQEGPLKPSAAAEILNQICGALDEAHRLQIVHRDLKPDNIVVKNTINGLHVKVLDFGIAKLRDLSANILTQTGGVMGTPHYMSPEQCLGEEIDHRSDIYSLGIVLYEMLAGVVPFNRPTSTAVVVQQVNDPPPPLRKINAAISPAVEAVVLQALAKKQEDRPQSALALAAAFSTVVNADLPASVVSPPPAAGQAVGGSARLNPTVVVTPIQRPSIGQTNTTPVGGEGGQNKVSTGLIIVGALGLLAIGALVAILLIGPRGTNPANNAAPSPQPTIDTASAASSSPATSARESSPPNLREIAPAPAPKVRLPAVDTSKPPPPVSSLPDQFQRRYTGSIGNGKSFSMTLERSGSYLRGTATTYGPNGRTDNLSGELYADGRFKLEDNRQTGIYAGKIHNDGTVTEGLWTSTEGKGAYRFYLQ